MKSNNIVILKIGGSVLSDKTRPFSVNFPILNSISEELKNINFEKLIIVHGGGSFGHPIAKKYNLTRGLTEDSRIGVSETHNTMLELNRILVRLLSERSIPTVTLAPLDLFITSKGRITKSFLNPILSSLANKIVPVLFGDTVFDEDQGVSILSGDQIISYLGAKLPEVSQIIIGTDVDGLFTADPKINKKAELIRKITPENLEEVLTIIGEANNTQTIDVTGGMRGKIIELSYVAKKGVKIKIINLTVPGNLTKAIMDKPINCTEFADWV